jgi:hypothetical protein
MNYATDVALEFGEYMVTEMQDRYDELEFMIQDEEVYTAAILDEYICLDTQLEMLSKALDELKYNQLQLALKTGIKELTA